MLDVAGEQQLAGHVEDEQRLHAVERDPVPQLGGGEIGEAARLAEQVAGGRRGSWRASVPRRRPARQAACASGGVRPYRHRESGGQCSRQPGQVRKEAAVTNSRWVVPGSHRPRCR